MLLQTCILLFIVLFYTPQAYAQEYGWGTTIENETKKVKIGGRLQAILVQDSETEAQDFYLRRTRLNLEYKPWAGHTFVYDIRNDGANSGDDGEKTFNIGDAYWKIDLNKNTINNIKLFRAKVDVSYSQTSSSKNLFNPQRAEVSEHASDFVVHNRRAVNAQINGNIENLAYQIVISDGVNSENLSALSGDKISEVNYQKLTYGSKIRYFFIGDAKKNKAQDTFYGLYDTFSLGLGFFANDKINVDNSNNSTGLQEFSFNRKLTNLDLSYSYKNFRLLAEYFEFSGDLIDLEALNKEDIVGESSGYYTQLEYVFGKWAPYIIYENFDKNKDADSAIQTITTVGINFYQRLEATRFGIAHKSTKNAKDIGDNSFESIYGYFMLNF
jgi:hypothetical protein